jgi:hypothetical protein
MSAAYEELLQRVDHMEKRIASETATRRDSCDTDADFDADILRKLRLLLETQRAIELRNEKKQQHRSRGAPRRCERSTETSRDSSRDTDPRSISSSGSSDEMPPSPKPLLRPTGSYLSKSTSRGVRWAGERVWNFESEVVPNSPRARA